MFDWILKPLGKLLSFLNSITGNYLIAIFLFALLFKILLFPLSIKQQKSQLKQAKLQPKIMAIRKKYNGRENDPEAKQRMQQETMDLYTAEGANPMGGCLPMLLQLPIIMILYSIIQNPLRYICGVSTDAITKLGEVLGELTGSTYSNSLSMMKDLGSNWNAEIQEILGMSQSELPNFKLFGMDLAVTPTSGAWYYWLIPILTFVTIFLSSKLTRKLSYNANDPAMNEGCSMWIMDLAMPLMSTFFAATFPSLLGIYWMFNNLLGVIQQLILRAMYPAPVFTEADYKEAERALRGKGPKNPANDSRVIPGKKYVSLHHIDDDDEIELPVLAPDSRELGEDDPPIPSEAPKLKDESDKPKKKKKG